MVIFFNEMIKVFAFLNYLASKDALGLVVELFAWVLTDGSLQQYGSILRISRDLRSFLPV